MNVQALSALSPELFAVAPNLSHEIVDGRDSESGCVGNLADACSVLSLMPAEQAQAHAQEHLPAMVARVLPALDREAPELAARLREASGQ